MQDLLLLAPSRHASHYRWSYSEQETGITPHAALDNGMYSRELHQLIEECVRPTVKQRLTPIQVLDRVQEVRNRLFRANRRKRKRGVEVPEEADQLCYTPEQREAFRRQERRARRAARRQAGDPDVRSSESSSDDEPDNGGGDAGAIADVTEQSSRSLRIGDLLPNFEIWSDEKSAEQVAPEDQRLIEQRLLSRKRLLAQAAIENLTSERESNEKENQDPAPEDSESRSDGPVNEEATSRTLQRIDDQRLEQENDRIRRLAQAAIANLDAAGQEREHEDLTSGRESEAEEEEEEESNDDDLYEASSR